MLVLVKDKKGEMMSINTRFVDIERMGVVELAQKGDEVTCGFVVEIKTVNGRLPGQKYITNDVFSSKEKAVAWMEKTTNRYNVARQYSTRCEDEMDDTEGNEKCCESN